MRVFFVSLCAAALAVFISYPAPATAADAMPTGEMAAFGDLLAHRGPARAKCRPCMECLRTPTS